MTFEEFKEALIAGLEHNDQLQEKLRDGEAASELRGNLEIDSLDEVEIGNVIDERFGVVVSTFITSSYSYTLGDVFNATLEELKK